MSEHEKQQVEAQSTQADATGEMADGDLEAVAGGSVVTDLIDAAKRLVDSLAGPIV